MKRVSFRFGTDGTGRAVYDDNTARVARAIGTVAPRRASHVEPAGDGWSADMSPVGGPLLLAADGQPFTTRAAALDAERAWLEAAGVPLPL